MSEKSDPEMSPESDDVNARDSEARTATSRRKLLKAGAAAVPVMVSIKSTTAFAEGFGSRHGGWGDWEWGDGGKGGVYASISCIQNVDMPGTKKKAINAICDKYGFDRPTGHKYWDKRKNLGTYKKFYDYFRTTDFAPYQDYLDPRDDRHCTYMNIMLSTACLDSIKGGGKWAGGKHIWDFKKYGKGGKYSV